MMGFGWLRRLGCSMNVRHDIEEKWWPKETSGLSPFAAALYGCEEKDGGYQYFECRDCGTKMAPFEARERGWA